LKMRGARLLQPLKLQVASTGNIDSMLKVVPTITSAEASSL